MEDVLLFASFMGDLPLIAKAVVAFAAVAVTVAVVMAAITAAPVVVVAIVAVTAGLVAGVACYAMCGNGSEKIIEVNEGDKASGSGTVPKTDTPTPPEPEVVITKKEQVSIQVRGSGRPFTCDITVEGKTKEIRCDDKDAFKQAVQEYLKSLPTDKKTYNLSLSENDLGKTNVENIRSWKKEILGD